VVRDDRAEKYSLEVTGEGRVRITRLTRHPIKDRAEYEKQKGEGSRET